MSAPLPRNRAERRAQRDSRKTRAVKTWKRAMKGVHAPETIINLGRNGGRHA